MGAKEPPPAPAPATARNCTCTFEQSWGYFPFFLLKPWFFWCILTSNSDLSWKVTLQIKQVSWLLFSLFDFSFFLTPVLLAITMSLFVWLLDSSILIKFDCACVFRSCWKIFYSVYFIWHLLRTHSQNEFDKIHSSISNFKAVLWNKFTLYTKIMTWNVSKYKFAYSFTRFFH